MSVVLDRSPKMVDRTEVRIEVTVETSADEAVSTSDAAILV